MGGIDLRSIIGYTTTAGIVKKVNQDSLCIKSAMTPRGEVVMAVVCDGMGGLEKGELASATVVKAFDAWFVQILPYLMPTITWQKVQDEFNRLIQETNEKIHAYGQEHDLHLGTTLTVMLMVGKEFSVTANVGDTRLYRIDENLVEQVTDDQTLVAQEVRDGLITEKQAEVDSRRNILLQCIGFEDKVYPVFDVFNCQVGETYLLCSDGFRHEITDSEILANLRPSKLNVEAEIQLHLEELVALNELRKERDNITAVAITLKEKL
jgi:serine/threonine protein phosphatase PrpC